jgi:hypothetical protein
VKEKWKTCFEKYSSRLSPENRDILRSNKQVQKKAKVAFGVENMVIGFLA